MSDAPLTQSPATLTAPLTTLLCDNTTPFGRPVLPDV